MNDEMTREEKIQACEDLRTRQEKIERCKEIDRQMYSVRHKLSNVCRTWRRDDDHVFAVHVERPLSGPNYFFLHKVQSPSLFDSGHRLCFKNLKDIRDFMEHIDAVKERDLETTAGYYETWTTQALDKFLAFSTYRVLDEFSGEQILAISHLDNMHPRHEKK